jgi:hypothetical protein
MPVEIVLDNAVVISAPGPAFRLIVALSAVFWRGECRPLPADDAGLCALARCGQSSWRKEGAKVREALGHILPQLHSHHTHAVQRANNFRRARAEAGQKGAMARWHKPMAAVSPLSLLQDPFQPRAQTWPSTAPGQPPSGLRAGNASRLSTPGTLHDVF